MTVTCPKCQSDNPEKKKFQFIYKRTWIVFLLITIFTSGFFLRIDTVKTIWSISYFGEDDFFHRPSDIEVDMERALVYVADSGNHRVLVFDFQGEFLKIIGNKGQGPAEFSNPTGIHILEDGKLAVADVGNLRIQIFDKDWEFVKSIKTKGVQVADMIFKDNKIYTISCFGSSGYSLDTRTEKHPQPLVQILDNQGNLIQNISVNDFPESHPFLRAIKHRVCLALSKAGKLYIPHFAMNVIHVFDLEGRKISEFDRALPFKPGAPKLIRQISGKDGSIRMQATFDFITKDAKVGPGGNLYLLTFTESYMDRTKRKSKEMDLPPHPVRIDVIDTKTYEVIRNIECDADTRAFALADESCIVYAYVDSEGEVILKCIQF